MGTFHKDKSALHGITVVVDTTGPRVYVGRCEDEDDEQVALVDADFHDDGQNGKSKAEYIQRATKFGVWKKLEHVAIPRGEVASITRLGGAATVVATPHGQPKAGLPVPHEAGTALVTLTPSARDEVRRLLDVEDKPGLGLRLGVKGGGCSGFAYKLDFDLKKEGDLLVDCGEFCVYLDRKSVIYLRGITLDYQKGLSGRGFVFHNPNATNTCGCGESFSI